MSDKISPLSSHDLDDLTSEFEGSKSNVVAMNAVTAAGINKVARNYDRARLLQRRFSTSLDNGEATHQDRSGRCWLFSSLNVARYVAKKTMNIKEFEFSQNYAMYFDKLERVNYFLQDIANLIREGEPTDSRLFQHMLHDVMGDGGQWTMAMNVYKKYGAVPKDLYPETESSKNTGELDTQLRRMLHTAVSQMEKSPEHIDEIILQASRRPATAFSPSTWASRRRASTGSGPTRTASSTAWVRSRRSSSGTAMWATPIWRATSASSTIRATSTPRARRSASNTSTMWPEVTRPNTSTCRSSS